VDDLIDGESPKMRRPNSLTHLPVAQAYSCVDELFGKVLGIERVLLCSRSDTLLQAIEKINLIPEHKLVFVEPVAVQINDRIILKPKVANLISISDVCNVFQQINF
jgi:hypothetical protein